MSDPKLVPYGPAPKRRAVRRARAYYRARRVREAVAAYRDALRLGLAPAAIAKEYWMCCMLLGDFAQAWRVSDGVLRRRMMAPQAAGLPYHLRAVWDGTPLRGRRVWLRCFHGLGDTIQFIRFAPIVRSVAAELIVEAQAELLPLLSSVPGIGRLVPLAGEESEIAGEVAIEAMEVPHALRLTPADLPGLVPYLSVDPRHQAARRAEMGAGRLKVGLAWAAGAWDERRSVPLALLAGLTENPGIDLFCLQRGPGLVDIQAGRAIPRFVDEAVRSDDISETAATIANLDLVISADTMVAHLAGAQGIPVWTLLHFAADWRWLVGRDDTPWYPTMRLFRQTRPGDWRDPVDRVLRRLAAIGAAGPYRPRSVPR